jgi:dipeptidyl aminopeptidase/acylaminoacyl peptidase
MNTRQRKASLSHRTLAVVGCLLVTASFAVLTVALPSPPRYVAPKVLNVPSQLRGATLQHSGSATTMAVAPDARRIAYSAGYKDAEVWVADLPTDRHESLVHQYEGASVVALEWSHDGRQLLTLTSGANGSKLHVSSMQDYRTLEVAAMREIEDAHWNPKTNLVVFSGYTGTGWNLFVANSTTAVVTPLTKDGHDSCSSWAPDGRTVLFSRSRGNSSNIWSISSSGVETQVTNVSAMNVRPMESANGTIAFLSNILGTWSVYSTSSSGGFQNLVIYNLTSAVVDVSNSSHLYWSPDGTKLVVETASPPGASSSYIIYTNATVALTPNSFPLSKRHLFVPGMFRHQPLVFDISRMVGEQVDAVGWLGNEALIANDASRGTLVLISFGPMAQVTSNVYGR